MDVYRVMFRDNDAIAAYKVDDDHGSIGIDPDSGMINWFALECEDEETAMEIADKIVKTLWGNRSWQNL